MPDTLHSRAVTRACELLGNTETLAERLGVSVRIVSAWMTGRLAPPPRYFFKVVDILQEAALGSAALRAGDSDRARAKGGPAD
jgi:hypothetical protein